MVYDAMKYEVGGFLGVFSRHSVYQHQIIASMLVLGLSELDHDYKPKPTACFPACVPHHTALEALIN